MVVVVVVVVVEEEEEEVVVEVCLRMTKASIDIAVNITVTQSLNHGIKSNTRMASIEEAAILTASPILDRGI